jgi:hypothetical protein
MRRRTLVIGSVVLAGATLVLFCCGGGQHEANAPTAGIEPARAAPDAGAEAPAAATPPPAATPSAVSSEVAPAASTPPLSPGARIAQTLSASDPRDLKLLAGIERELHRDPPPEIHALIAARKRGAGRDELVRSIQSVADMPLRALAFRWLDEVAPAADAGSH